MEKKEVKKCVVPKLFELTCRSTDSQIIVGDQEGQIEMVAKQMKEIHKKLGMKLIYPRW